MLRLFAWLRFPLSYVPGGIDVLSREAKHAQPRAGFETNPGTGRDSMKIMGLPA